MSKGIIYFILTCLLIHGVFTISPFRQYCLSQCGSLFLSPRCSRICARFAQVTSTTVSTTTKVSTSTAVPTSTKLTTKTTTVVKSLVQNAPQTEVKTTTTTTRAVAPSSSIIVKIMRGEYYASSSLFSQLISQTITMTPSICYNENDSPSDMSTARFPNGSLRYPFRNSYGYFACPLTGKLRPQECCGNSDSQTCCDVIPDEGLSTVSRIIVSSITVIIGLIIVLLCWRLCCVLKKHRKSLKICCDDCCPTSVHRRVIRRDIYVHTSAPRTTASRNVAPVPSVSAAVEHTRSPALSNNSAHSRSTTSTTSSSRPQRTQTTTTSTTSSSRPQRTQTTTTSRQRTASQQRSNPRTQNGAVERQQRSRSAHGNSAAYVDDDLPSYSELFRGDGTETQRGKRTQGKFPPPPPSYR